MNRIIYSITVFAAIAVSSHGEVSTNLASVESPWDHFGIGSWVILEKTSSTPESKSQTRDKVMIVDRATGQPALGVARQINGGFEPRFRPGRHVSAVTPEQLGMRRQFRRNAKVTIDDGRHRVRLERYTLRHAGLSLRRTLTLWRSADLRVPYRSLVVDRGANIALDPDVLRAEYIVELGSRTTSYNVRISQLSATVEVGDHSVTCAVEESVDTVDDRGEQLHVASTRHLSWDVPGHVVRMQTTVTTDGDPFVVTQRAEGFHAARVASGH